MPIWGARRDVQLRLLEIMSLEVPAEVSGQLQGAQSWRQRVKSFKGLDWYSEDVHRKLKFIGQLVKAFRNSSPNRTDRHRSRQTRLNSLPSLVLYASWITHYLDCMHASSLKVTDHNASPHLWNKLPFSIREPVSPLYAYLNPSFSSPLSPSITPSLFHSKLKTYLFGKSFPP